MGAERKVAIITGGASGIGLAVAQALAARGDWDVHILDVNKERAEEAAEPLENATAHKADVTDYGELASVFQNVFGLRDEARLDFVFANAGIIESTSFYKAQTTDPPPEPDLKTIDVNLKAVILTAYLAQHYFRQSPHQGKGASLILTASCGALYPSYFSPIYTAAKFGVLGFGRAIAKQLFLEEGIRVNVICPGIVETNLVGEGGWEAFQKALFTPVSQISNTVLILIDGKEELVDNAGKRVAEDKLYGLAVEVNLDRIYVRDQHPFSDDDMRRLMELTNPENQNGTIIKEY